jgi:hypothetical protein
MTVQPKVFLVLILFFLPSLPLVEAAVLQLVHLDQLELVVGQAVAAELRLEALVVQGIHLLLPHLKVPMVEAELIIILLLAEAVAAVLLLLE